MRRVARLASDGETVAIGSEGDGDAARGGSVDAGVRWTTGGRSPWPEKGRDGEVAVRSTDPVARGRLVLPAMLAPVRGECAPPSEVAVRTGRVDRRRTTSTAHDGGLAGIGAHCAKRGAPPRQDRVVREHGAPRRRCRARRRKLASHEQRGVRAECDARRRRASQSRRRRDSAGCAPAAATMRTSSCPGSTETIRAHLRVADARVDAALPPRLRVFACVDRMARGELREERP